MDRAEAIALVRSKAEKETTVRHLITVEGVMRPPRECLANYVMIEGHA